MSGLFDFFNMVGNYSERAIARYDGDNLMVDTCRVTDGDHPFETAVQHPDYNGGKMVIVQAYDTREQAQEGHDRWVMRMTADTLPDELVDCQNCAISQLLPAEEMKYPRKGVTVTSKTTSH